MSVDNLILIGLIVLLTANLIIAIVMLNRSYKRSNEVIDNLERALNKEAEDMFQFMKDLNDDIQKDIQEDIKK